MLNIIITIFDVGVNEDYLLSKISMKKIKVIYCFNIIL